MICEQTAEHGLLAQGLLGKSVELRARGLGTVLLRELACESEVAAPRTLRQIPSDDQLALELCLNYI